jgi:ABC-type amino acid transport substrate-binding protein
MALTPQARWVIKALIIVLAMSCTGILALFAKNHLEKSGLEKPAPPDAATTAATQAPAAPPVAVTQPPGTPAKAAPAAGPAVARIQARGELLVGMDTGEPPWTGTPPMYFPNEKGEPDGFDYVLAQKIAVAVGVPKVKVVHGKYSELPGMLESGNGIDLIVSGWVPSDEPHMAFSEPYLDFGLCLVVPAKSKIATTADLWGKPIGIFDDDAAAAEVTRIVKGYTKLERMEDGYWDVLANGGIAAFIYDYPYAAAEIVRYYKQNPQRAGSFRIAQYNLTDSHYAVAVRSSDLDLLAAVNAAIEVFRASDAYGETIKKYLSGGEAVTMKDTKGKHTYTVKAGDTLSGIAQRELGDLNRWKDLWTLNRSRFPNPHLIEVGDVVVLP